ncbi:DNA-methyltransferase [Clostridium perfringens]|uniref:DNA-methyltransferase n=1 Tax=Clostridium perfringens TaxID=1502 RepID=UPI000E1A8BFF|nr:site-specific DNA-methyltransferase [Clostridium perfringens]SUY37510.1 DNA modification methylase [Clostridium perfringens]
MKKNIIYLESSENMSNIKDKSIDLIVTSPPYNIDIKYGNKTSKGKIIESKGVKYSDKFSEEDYRAMLKNVFNECKRVLKDDGSIWINIKNRLINGVVTTPFWIEEYFEDMYLKNLLVWNFDWGGSTSKRFAPRYEFVFWYTKDKSKYTFNLEDVKIPALNYRPDRYKSQLKNPSDVWRISMVSGNFAERTEHPAQYPERLVERIILAGSNKGDIVLDPFMGSGTTAVVAKKLKRDYIGYELVPEYLEMAKKRLDLVEETNE